MQLAENLEDQFDPADTPPGADRSFIQSTTVMYLPRSPAAAPADSERGNESDQPRLAGQRPGRRKKETLMFFGVGGTPRIRSLFYRNLARRTEQAAQELSGRGRLGEIAGSLRRSENYSSSERSAASFAPFALLSPSQVSSAEPPSQDAGTNQSATNPGAASIDGSGSEGGEDEAVKRLRDLAQSFEETAAAAALETSHSDEEEEVVVNFISADLY